MSTFLTKQEQNVAEKYLQFCERFGVLPMNNYEELITKYNKHAKDLPIEELSDHEEAIVIYKKRCNDFNIPISENLDKKTTGEIWDYILRDTDKVIYDEFGIELVKIKDVVLRAKIKVAIQALYDEGIYVKKEQTAALFACENNNEEIQEKYENLGGKEKLLALSETSSYLFEDDEYEEEEEENNEKDF